MKPVPLVHNLPFRSKEVSWLSFNARVLQEAEDPDVPLLERLRFLGIYSSNMDEFFRVRVATLRRLARMGDKLSLGNLPDPKFTLSEVKAWVKLESKRFEEALEKIVLALKKENVFLITDGTVPKEAKEWLKAYFHREVRHRIMPVMVRSYSQLSGLRDHPLYLAVQLVCKQRTDFALIEIPQELPRFLVIPAKGAAKRHVIFLEDLIRNELASIFAGTGYTAFDAWAVKFTRDAEMTVDDDITESLLDKITHGLKARETGQVVRINYDREMPVKFRRLLLSKLKLQADEALMGSRYHNRRDFVRFPNILGEAGSYPAVEATAHPRISESSKSIIKAIQKQDVLLHFPYHSFSHFLDFLREACLDPMVLAIQLTQYRAARHSAVARALVTAATNGKQVTVLVEPQARFDEKNNLDWAEVYQQAGIKVILGVPNLKVHAKMCLVTRSEGGKEVGYAAVGTGNFNEDTARFYTDHMLLTANKELVQDVAQAFAYFRNIHRPPVFKHLSASPFNLRGRIIELIQAEMANVSAGKPAGIMLKLNNMSDYEVMRHLYNAAAAGVPIRILCRGMFSLVAGVKKWSENIEGRGIVDRYLEHSRLLLFQNGGDPKVFLTSADFLGRNFDSRFELLCPVLDRKAREQLLEYLDIQWSDTVKARVLNATLTNERAGGKAAVRSQLKIAERVAQHWR
jgi:polyphosphate kinase